MRYCLSVVISILVSSPVYAGVSEPVCFPADYGGQGDGHTLNTNAIQKAIDTCASEGGGKIQLTRGVWLTGPLSLKSNISLIIPRGAVLQAVDNQKAFVPAFIGQHAQKGEALLLADNVHDVDVSGGGEINGNGHKTWWPQAMALRERVRSGHPEAFTERYKNVPLANGMPRPWLFELNNSSYIKIDNVRLTDSPMWDLVIRKSHHIDVSHLTVSNPPDSPNTDGIDIVSSGSITVRHADISTGDDHISIKSGIVSATGKSSGNITASDSIMRKGHGISIGSETINRIRVKSGRDRGSLSGHSS